MKKVVLASLLTVAFTAPAVGTAFAQAAAAPAGGACSGANVQMAQDEYAAYNNANTQSDPKAKAAAFEAYLKAYPKSCVQGEVLNQLVYLYSSQNDKANALNAADRLLAIDPNNLRALTLEVYFRKQDADAMTDQTAKAAAMDPVVKYAQAGLAAPKPKDVSDADWTKLQATTKPTFESALGDAAMAKNDYAGAISDYKTELGEVPVEQTQTPGPTLQDMVYLANAYMKATPPDYLSCAWYAERAAVYAGQFASQIEPLAKYCYHKYHGNTDDQYPALQAAVKTSLTPPADLGTTTIKPAPKPEDIVANLIATTPDLATLAISDKEFVLQYGKQADADKVFDTIKGKSVELPGVVASATDSQVMLEVSDDAKQGKTADFTINMKAPMTKVPAAGETVTVTGTYASYTQSPLMIVMNDGELVVKKAPAKKAAPAHHAPARRR